MWPVDTVEVPFCSIENQSFQNRKSSEFKFVLILIFLVYTILWEELGRWHLTLFLSLSIYSLPW